MILTQAKSDEVAERLRSAVEAALEARNLSARRASIDVVGHDGLIRDIRAGRIPSVDRIEALFDYLGLEAYFGPRRLKASAIAANHEPGEDAPTGFLTIPWAESGSRPGSAPVAFSRAWLSAHDLVPDFLVAVLPDEVRIEGPPTADTVALLDTRVALRKGHGIFCSRLRGQVIVSHMTFAGSVTVIHPAHSDQEPVIYEGSLSGVLALLGKVVWMGQSVPVRGRVG
ncbi:MAG: hypothetical protein MUE83_00825 [Tabrizicola sp.]|jgi:hypothetical protein|nr:hypothetical protein [Tabrizicola sp.]